MKRFFCMVALALAVFAAGAQEHADGNVTLTMADGSTLRGYCRTEFENAVKFIEISDTPRGERVRYDNDQVDRVVFDGGAVYVKKDIIVTAKGKNPKKDEWVRLDFEGTGLTLYSRYVTYTEQVNTSRHRRQERIFYLSLGDDPAVWVGTDFLSGGTANRAGFNRSMLNYYFSKRYPEYSDFARRIKNKEFDTKHGPLEVVEAWQKEYGGQ